MTFLLACFFLFIKVRFSTLTREEMCDTCCFAYLHNETFLLELHTDIRENSQESVISKLGIYPTYFSLVDHSDIKHLFTQVGVNYVYVYYLILCL